MKSDVLNIAIVQMTSVDSLAANLHKFETTFSSLRPGSIDLICFPENCLYMRVNQSEGVERFELSHSCFMWLGEWARRLKTTIHLGSVPLLLEGKLYNSSIWIPENGKPQVGYQKMHLFDIELTGQKPIRESDTFERGSAGVIRDFKGWFVGESICYDVRFSELYSGYAYAGVDLILVPSAFLVETGRAHWEVLLRARAIESQCYLLASAQVGTHSSTKSNAERKTYGHSLLIDPWGNIEADLGDIETLRVHQINKEKIKKVREQIPMAQHRRGRKDQK